MAIGDTFGGLAADRRAINSQSSANWFNDISAQRAQQAQDIAAQQADRNYMLQVRQLNDQAANQAYNRKMQQDALANDADRYNLEFATRRQDTAANQALAQDQADLNWAALNQKGDLRDEMAAQKLEQVDAAGNSLANSFSEAKSKSDAADKQLRDLLDEQTRVAQQAANMGYVFDARSGLLKAPKVLGPRQTPEMLAKFNDHMMALNNDLKQAKQDAALGYHGLNVATRTAAGAGFDLLPDQGIIVHRRTGKQFNFGQPQGLTESDMVNMGYFAPEAAPAPAAPTPVPPQAALPPVAQWSLSPAYQARMNPPAIAAQQPSEGGEVSGPRDGTVADLVPYLPNMGRVGDAVLSSLVSGRSPMQTPEGLIPLNEQFDVPINRNQGMLPWGRDVLAKWTEPADEAVLRRLSEARKQYPNAQLVKRGGEMVQTFQGVQRSPEQYFIDIGVVPQTNKQPAAVSSNQFPVGQVVIQNGFRYQRQPDGQFINIGPVR